MDLISALAQQLGVPANTAQAVAGVALGGVRGAVEQHAGGDAARQLDGALPELGGWKEQAAALMGGGGSSGGGGLGGLLGGAGGALGGLGGLLGGAASGSSGGGLLGSALGALQGAQDTAALAGLLGKVGIDGSKAALVAPLLLDFLRSRLDPGLLQTVLGAAPFLAKLGGSGGGIAGALGGLLGR